MNVIDLLMEDHREVNELFRRFQLASKPETLADLSAQIIRELSIHSAVEEQFIYPLCRTNLPDGDEVADHSISEHDEMKELLAKVEKLNPGSAAHSRTMMKVIESTQHHIDEEESDILNRLRSEVSEETLKRVGELVDKAKRIAPTHPHPNIPGTATAQLVAGPWAGLVDRARDLIGA